MKEKNVRSMAESGRQAEITFKTKLTKNKHVRLTFTFKALSVETPQQTATVVTECGALVVIVLEAMRHINLKALFLELQTHRNPSNPQIIKVDTCGTYMFCQF